MSQTGSLRGNWSTGKDFGQRPLGILKKTIAEWLAPKLVLLVSWGNRYEETHTAGNLTWVRCHGAVEQRDFDFKDKSILLHTATERNHSVRFPSVILQYKLNFILKGICCHLAAQGLEMAYVPTSGQWGYITIFFHTARTLLFTLSHKISPENIWHIWHPHTE